MSRGKKEKERDRDRDRNQTEKDQEQIDGYQIGVVWWIGEIADED